MAGDQGWSALWSPVHAGRASLPGISEPFVLLDDWNSGATAQLFSEPHAIITAHSADEVAPALDRVRQSTREGAYAAGYLTYDAARGLGHSVPRPPGNTGTASRSPMLWFGLFGAPQPVRLPSVGLPPVPTGGYLHRPGHRARDDRGRLTALMGHLRAGLCDEVQLVVEAMLDGLGNDPRLIYESLRSVRKADWGGMVSTGGVGFASFSSELLFAQQGGEIWTKTFVDTLGRAARLDDDMAQRQDLARSGRSARARPVAASILAELQRVSGNDTSAPRSRLTLVTRPTAHELSSVVSIRSETGRDGIGLLRAMFPSQSTVGLPKLSAMEVIAATEPNARGAFGGSMGFIAPDGRAAFNVLTQTLEYDAGRSSLLMKIGANCGPTSTLNELLRAFRAQARFLEACAHLGL
ncbi:chorismate-binding protein [Novosphingobium flavum]|uniref:Chorismate-binding protein n=1 Tax=Novosphingobium flavum TaxID=1778672 RepID=A0A7X1FQ67_9SPHN|nr:chorismate-binding protein [Novosphingobium flavum]MBC2664809.1 chorismate-binding protein [Novosphingobium flavum]